MSETFSADEVAPPEQTTFSAEEVAPPQTSFAADEVTPPQGTLAAAGNSFAQAAVSGVANLVKGAGAIVAPGPPMFTLESEGLPLNQDQQDAIDAYVKQVQTESPAQRYARITNNPVFQFGQQLEAGGQEAYPVDPGQATNFLPRAAGLAGGFLPLIASGPAAPLTIGAQSYGEHLDRDFQTLKAQGLSDDQAAKATMSRAAASGALQAGIFSVLPPVLRKAGEQYIVDRIGTAGFKRWLAGRVATGAEGAALGAASQGAENVTTGQPVMQGTGAGATGMAAMNLLLPYGPTARELREQQRGAAVPAVNPGSRPADDALPPPVSTNGSDAGSPVQTSVVQVTDATGTTKEIPVTPATVDATLDDAAKLPDAKVELLSGDEAADQAKAAAPAQTQIADGNVQAVPAEQIATRPDLMQFKRMDDTDTGVNQADQLKGKWDPLKAGNLLLWEPADPAQYGLKDGEKYIVANGHHRFEFGEKQDVPAYNAQVVREADGYSAQDSRSLAAEINIADGKGTIYDATKFLRNESATHGPDEALARAGRIGVKGGQAATIAFSAGPDLYTSFVNEQIKPEQAEAIARSAPIDPRGAAGTRSGNEALQRLGIRKAIDGSSPAELRNLIQAVRLEGHNQPAEQFDLFAADDSAIQTAEQLASVASRIQGELSREIRATDAAAKNAVTAKAKGLSFDKPPSEILAENAKLKAERDRWDNWALHPDLINQVRGYAEMQRAGEGKRQAGTPKRASSEGEALPMPSMAAASVPPRTQDLPSQVSTRPEPSENLTMRATVSGGTTTGPSTTSNLDLSTTKKRIYQPAGDVNTQMARAREAQPVLDRVLKGLETKVPGVEFVKSRVKGDERLAQKLSAKKPEEISDYLAARVAVDTPAHINDAVAALEQTGRIRQVDNMLRDRPEGYRAVHLQYELPNGLTAEVQLIPRPMLDAVGEYHKVYTKWRHAVDLTPEMLAARKADTDRATAAYNEAYKKFVQPADTSTPDMFSGQTLDQKLQSLKIDTSGQVHAFGLLPAAWNGIIDAVRVAVAGGMKIADAVHNVIERFKAANPGTAFDEAGARAHLNGLAERGFTDKLRQAEDVASGIKEGVTNTLYTRRTNETDAQLATRIVQERGVPAAIGMFADKNNGLPGSVRGLLGQQIIKNLSAAGDIQGAIDFHDNHFADHITDVAQTLQAQRAWLALTPEGQILWAKKQLDQAGNDRVAPVRPDLEDAKAELQRHNAAGIQAATRDQGVQDTAKAAVNEAVAGSAETHKAVVMELAPVWAQSKYILDTAREQVRAKAAELMKAPQPPGLTPSAHLTQILDDLAKRAAGIAANYFQGYATHPKGLTGLLSERLGLEEKRAQTLARALETKWASEVNKAKAKLPGQIRAARARSPLDAISSDNKVDAALRRQIKDQQQTMGAIVHRHFTDQAQTGKDLAAKLVQQAGISGPMADTLAQRIQQRFAQMTSDAKRRALERILKPVQSQGIAREGLVDRLLKLSNVGAFDDAKYWNAVKEKLNLPAWTPELQTRLKLLADKIAAIPEDRQADWQKAQTDFMNELNRAKGFSWFDANHALFITNLLSGLTTHLKVAIHTSANMAGALSAELGRAVVGNRVADIPLIFEALGKGVGKAVADQADIFRTGVSTGSKVDNVFGGKFHELANYGTKGGVPIDTTRGNLAGRTYAKVLKAGLETTPAKILNLWKYNDRLVTAQHVLYYKPAEEMKVALLTSRMQRERGMNPADAAREARNILGYGAQAVAEAKAQAAREGLTGYRATKRAGEILELRRPVETTESARSYALRQTFLNEPYGFVGAMANVIQNAKDSGDDSLNRAAKVAAPFTKIAANIFNEGLNYTPWGLVRAGIAKKSLLGIEFKDINPADRRDLRAEVSAKAVLGTALLGGIAFAAAKGLGQANPGFAVYGSGPSNPEDAARWRATGAIPWSIKAGNRYISYANTPANVSLAAYGNYLDKLRDARLYKRANAERVAESAVNSLAVALQGTGGVVLQQPYIQQLTELLALTTEKNPELASRSLEKLIVRTTSSAVVPNLLRQIDRFGDPNVYDQKKLDGILTSAVPWFRRTGQPVLNALGQPLQSPVTTMFVSRRTDDPVVKTLDKYNVWPTTPARNSTLVQGVPMTDDEWYRYNQARGQALRDLMSLPAFEKGLAAARAQGDKYIAAAQTLANQGRAPVLAAKGQALPQTLVRKYDEEAAKRGAAAVIKMRGGQ